MNRFLCILLSTCLFMVACTNREPVNFEEGGKYAEMGSAGQFELRAAEAVIAYDHAIKRYHQWAIRNLEVVTENETLMKLYQLATDELDDTISGNEPLGIYYALKSTYEASKSTSDQFTFEQQVLALEQITLNLLSKI